MAFAAVSPAEAAIDPSAAFSLLLAMKGPAEPGLAADENPVNAGCCVFACERS